MTGLRNVFGLAALGSALVWSSAGWAQQESDKPSQEEPAQRERATRHEKSNRERRELLKKQTEELTDRMRRLNREPLRRGIEVSAPPFRFNLRGDWYLSEPRPNDLGASIVPADESLRTQLGLTDGQGLIVKSVAHGGPAFQIGLQANDVLTSLADKPLATPADLIKQLKEAGEKVVPLQVLRSGKSMTIQVKPIYHVTFGPVETTRPRYLLGVQVESLDETLRAQLKLPDQEGLLVNAVEPESAAEKAGFKKYDILLAVGDQPLKGSEDLVSRIQNSSGKALTFKLLRGGKTITVEVTPTIQPDAEAGSHELGLEPSVRAVRPSGMIWDDHKYNWTLPARPPHTVVYDPLWRQQTENFPVAQAFGLPHPSELQFGELQGEVKELRRLIENLQKSLQAKPDSDHTER